MGKIYRRPKTDDIYFTFNLLDASKPIIARVWNNDITDEFLLKINLVFETKELAKKEYNKIIKIIGHRND